MRSGVGSPPYHHPSPGTNAWAPTPRVEYKYRFDTSCGLNRSSKLSMPFCVLVLQKKTQLKRRRIESGWLAGGGEEQVYPLLRRFDWVGWDG